MGTGFGDRKLTDEPSLLPRLSIMGQCSHLKYMNPIANGERGGQNMSGVVFSFMWFLYFRWEH